MNTWLRGMLANSYYQLKRFPGAKSQFEAISKMELENDPASFMISVLEPLAGLDDDLFQRKGRPGKVELKPCEIEQRYGNAVIFVLVADKDKKVFKTGRGFLIDRNGLAVTNQESSHPKRLYNVSRLCSNGTSWQHCISRDL
jgi:hypothetical protein